MTRPPDAVPLHVYGHFLRRHRGLVLVAVTLGILAALLRLAAAPRAYSSAVTVLASPVIPHPGIGLWEREGPTAPVAELRSETMDTEAALVRSGVVLDRLAGLPGFPARRAALNKRITIAVPPNTRVMTIRVRAHTPGHARAGARVVVRAYLDSRRQLIGSLQKRNRQAISRRIEVLRRQLDALPYEPVSRARRTPRTRRQEILKRIDELRWRLAAYDQQAVTVSPPGPAGRAGGGGSVPLASGAGLGLLGGLALALIRRPRRPDVTLPGATPVAVAGDDFEGSARRLRTKIFAVADEPGRRAPVTVFVCGVGLPRSASLAVLTAAACVRGGARTLLLLVGDEPLPGGDGFCALRVRTSDGDREIIAALRRAEADVVIAAGPPPGSAEAAVLATECDLSFVVVQRGRARTRDQIGSQRTASYASVSERMSADSPMVWPSMQATGATPQELLTKAPS